MREQLDHRRGFVLVIYQTGIPVKLQPGEQVTASSGAGRSVKLADTRGAHAHGKSGLEEVEKTQKKCVQKATNMLVNFGECIQSVRRDCRNEKTELDSLRQQSDSEGPISKQKWFTWQKVIQ